MGLCALSSAIVALLADASDIAVKPYNNDIYPLLVTACAGPG